jgi:hypothetical protein
MALIPCPVCNPCLDDTIPTTGYQSETPDADNVIAYNYGVPGVVPPLNSPFVQTTCVVSCEAPTQEEADQCAEVGQIECLAAPLSGVQCNVPTTPFFLNTPQTCSSECPDGSFFVFTVPAGTYAAFTQALANTMAQSFACSQVQSSKVCLGDLIPDTGDVGTPYSGEVTATGPGPYRFEIVSGSLPPGLQLQIIDSFHFAVQGTPTINGTYQFKVEAVDTRENFITKLYTITVSGALPNTYILVPETSNGAIPLQFTGCAALGKIFCSDFSLVSSSPDGVTWSPLGTTDQQCEGIGYGQGQFVAVGFPGFIATSPDAITWTDQSPPFIPNSINYVAFLNNLWVAPATDALFTSSDGINWNLIVPPGIDIAWKVDYGNGVWVMVDFAANVITSGDGVTWVVRNSNVVGSLYGVAFLNGIFVAVGSSGSNTPIATRSTDGLVWTPITIPSPVELHDVAAGNNCFVAVDKNGGAWRSADGVTWSLETTLPVANEPLRLFHFHDNVFVSVDYPLF